MTSLKCDDLVDAIGPHHRHSCRTSPGQPDAQGGPRRL